MRANLEPFVLHKIKVVVSRLKLAGLQELSYLVYFNISNIDSILCDSYFFLLAFLLINIIWR